MLLTIDEMIQEVPEGMVQTYPRIRGVGDAPERFLEVRKNFEYAKPRFVWANRPDRTGIPRAGSRNQPARSFENLEPCDLRLEGKLSKLADFYPTENGPYFLSAALLRILHAFDPSAVASRAETVVAKDGQAEFNLVTPARVLNAIDVERTEVRIRDEWLGESFFRRVDFPSGVLFVKDIAPTVHAFWDHHYRDWLWSRELLDACLAAGMKGLRASRTDQADPGTPYFL